MVNKGDNLAPKKKHKTTVKHNKVKKKIIKSKPKKVNAFDKKKKPKLPLKDTRMMVQKKEEVEKAIKKIYDEKEKLEMQRLYTILSEPYARQLLIDLAGENALEIVRNFYGNLSDEDLAKKLKLKISDVRATLNKLHSEGLVNYMRDKDNETGWYSYSWALNRDRIRQWVENRTKEKIDLVNGNLGDHYFCSSCGPTSVVRFEIATDASFKCTKCNKSLEFLDEDRIAELTDVRLRR